MTRFPSHCYGASWQRCMCKHGI